MKKVKFNDFEIIYNDGIAKLNATFENSDTTFSEQEIKNFLAAILQNITNIGDGYGNPISDNIIIKANRIVGQQKTF